MAVQPEKSKKRKMTERVVRVLLVAGVVIDVKVVAVVNVVMVPNG